MSKNKRTKRLNKIYRNIAVYKNRYIEISHQLESTNNTHMQNTLKAQLEDLSSKINGLINSL